MPKKSLDCKGAEMSSRLIEAILDENNPPDLRARMVSWFVSDMNDPEKYAAMEDFMNDSLQPSEEYNNFARQKFLELKQRIKVQEEEVSDKNAAPPRRFTIRKVAWRVAAVLIPFLVIMSAVYIGMNTKLGRIAEVTFEVQSGMQKDIFLSDSSRVWINSDSKITYAEEFGDERHLKLEGEAFFDVQRDEAKPFYVHTPKLDVVVLGTKFNVSAYPEKETTEVTLYEGSVLVVVGERTERLEPNSKLTYDSDTGEIVVEAIESREDWRSGYITVNGKTLAEIFDMIGNCYDITIEYDDAMLGSELFDTAFGEDQTPADVIRVLVRSHGGITFDEQEGTIIIKQRNNINLDSRKP